MTTPAAFVQLYSTVICPMQAARKRDRESALGGAGGRRDALHAREGRAPDGGEPRSGDAQGATRRAPSPVRLLEPSQVHLE